MKIKSIILLFFIKSSIFSQISTGNLEPNRYAQLDIVDSKKGILIPRVALQAQTSPQPISADALDLPISLLVFNTNDTADLDRAYYYWSGTQWNKVVIKEDLDALPKSPWNKAGTVNTAELNTDDIYQMGKVGIGVTNMTPNALLDVRGDALINTLTVGKGNGSMATNTAMGYQVLQDNTTGNYNTVMGYQAFRANTIGGGNIAIGYQALSLNTTGDANSASGSISLTKNTTGSHNTATGNSALYNNTTGGNNIANGAEALYSNTTGNYNTAVGRQALYTNTTGNYNTAIGYSAGPSSVNLSNTTAIGYNAKVTKSNTIQLGDTNIENVYTYGSFGIGATTTNAKVHIKPSTVVKDPLILEDMQDIRDANNSIDGVSAISYYNLKISPKGVIRKEMPQIEQSSITDLATNVTIATGNNLGSNGSWMTWRVGGSNVTDITLPEDGAYIFSFRLYGPITNQSTITSGTYYISGWKNTTTLYDIAELVVVKGTLTVSTYSVNLTISGVKGDKVRFKISSNGTALGWTLKGQPGLYADKTSMIYWKL